MSPRSFERLFPCGPDAVPEARHLLELALGERDPGAAGSASLFGGVLGNVLHVVTELMGVAAGSGARKILVRVEADERQVRVGVADDSPSCAVFRATRVDVDTARMSAAIVSALSERYGECFYDGQLREMWSQVTVPARLAAAEPPG